MKRVYRILKPKSSKIIMRREDNEKKRMMRIPLFCACYLIAAQSVMANPSGGGISRLRSPGKHR